MTPNETVSILLYPVLFIQDRFILFRLKEPPETATRINRKQKSWDLLDPSALSQARQQKQYSVTQHQPGRMLLKTQRSFSVPIAKEPKPSETTSEPSSDATDETETKVIFGCYQFKDRKL